MVHKFRLHKKNYLQKTVLALGGRTYITSSLVGAVLDNMTAFLGGSNKKNMIILQYKMTIYLQVLGFTVIFKATENVILNKLKSYESPKMGLSRKSNWKSEGVAS